MKPHQLAPLLAAFWLAGCCCPSNTNDLDAVPKVESPKKDKKKKKEKASKAKAKDKKASKDKVAAKEPHGDVPDSAPKTKTSLVSMDAGRFTVTFPGYAKKQSSTFDTAIGPVTQETWLHEQASDFVFSSIHGQFKDKVKRREFNIKAALEGGVDGAIGSLTGGRKIYSKKVTLGGYEGREFQSPVTLVGTTYTMTSRIFIAYRPKKKGSKISIEQYQLAIIHPKNLTSAQRKKVDSFFASAQIQE